MDVVSAKPNVHRLQRTFFMKEGAIQITFAVPLIGEDPEDPHAF